MDKKQRVLQRLKAKVKQLGFNQKELKGVAATIADKLELSEDASEEDINNAIDSAIEVAIPFLSVGQSQANRMLDEWKQNHPVETEDDEEDDEEEDVANARQSGSKKKNSKNKPQNDEEEPKWFKAYREQQETRLAKLEGEKTQSIRKSRLEGVLKDSGSFGKSVMKNFSRMKFETDEEFDDFVGEVEDDLKALNQERANEGLSTLGTPPAGGGAGKEDKPFTDEEIEEMANV